MSNKTQEIETYIAHGCDTAQGLYVEDPNIGWVDDYLKLVLESPKDNPHKCESEDQDIYYNVDSIRFVGRYLKDAPSAKYGKALTQGEVLKLSEEGIGIVSIWEIVSSDDPENGDDREVEEIYFTYEQGKKDAQEAIEAAMGFGQHGGKPIFFA